MGTTVTPSGCTSSASHVLVGRLSLPPRFTTSMRADGLELAVGDASALLRARDLDALAVEAKRRPLGVAPRDEEAEDEEAEEQGPELLREHHRVVEPQRTVAGPRPEQQRSPDRRREDEQGPPQGPGPTGAELDLPRQVMWRDGEEPSPGEE